MQESPSGLLLPDEPGEIVTPERELNRVQKRQMERLKGVPVTYGNFPELVGLVVMPHIAQAAAKADYAVLLVTALLEVLEAKGICTKEDVAARMQAVEAEALAEAEARTAQVDEEQARRLVDADGA